MGRLFVTAQTVLAVWFVIRAAATLRRVAARSKGLPRDYLFMAAKMAEEAVSSNFAAKLPEAP